MELISLTLILVATVVVDAFWEEKNNSKSSPCQK